jgi:hypothetical protein
MRICYTVDLPSYSRVHHDSISGFEAIWVLGNVCLQNKVLLASWVTAFAINAAKRLGPPFDHKALAWIGYLDFVAAFLEALGRLCFDMDQNPEALQTVFRGKQGTLLISYRNFFLKVSPSRYFPHGFAADAERKQTLQSFLHTHYTQTLGSYVPYMIKIGEQCYDRDYKGDIYHFFVKTLSLEKGNAQTIPMCYAKLLRDAVGMASLNVQQIMSQPLVEPFEAGTMPTETDIRAAILFMFLGGLGGLHTGPYELTVRYNRGHGFGMNPGQYRHLQAHALDTALSIPTSRGVLTHSALRSSSEASPLLNQRIMFQYEIGPYTYIFEVYDDDPFILLKNGRAYIYEHLTNVCKKYVDPQTEWMCLVKKSKQSKRRGILHQISIIGDHT